MNPEVSEFADGMQKMQPKYTMEYYSIIKELNSVMCNLKFTLMSQSQKDKYHSFTHKWQLIWNLKNAMVSDAFKPMIVEQTKTTFLQKLQNKKKGRMEES